MSRATNKVEKKQDIKKNLRLIAFFSINNLKEKYNNRYLKNKIDFFEVLKSSG